MLTQVLNRIDFLNTQFEERLKYDELRELQVKKLYDELDAYRQNAQIEQMMTLARGIFDVLDKLEPESSFQMSLDHLREELIECLAVVGIERIQDSTEVLGAQAQMVVGFLDDTSDVATRVRKQGYRLGESVVRKRQIEIKKASGSDR
jgi:molecular chaperone GrpE (heat shock protein)